MREILGNIQHPSHYAGIEDGICKKDPKTVRLHIALAFPDLYEVGMSYLGQKILYDSINQHEGWFAERCMAPEKETGILLEKNHILLSTLETDTNLKDLDCVGFSITHELCYTNVLYMLDRAGIALYHKDRTEKDPLIIAGGGALFGAEPLAPFIDLMLLGDGEEAFPKLLHLLEEAKYNKTSREEFLRKAITIQGVYVPSFFEEKEGKLVSKIDGYRPTRTIVADIDKIPYPVRQVVPIGAVHNRLSVEIARGCTRGCRFCQAGIVYRPVRERSVATTSRILKESLEATGFEEISFMALSTGDYSALKELSHTTLDLCQKEQISLSLPSQRVGSIDDSILARMADLRRTGMTLAPEAGSQRLRDVINKGISEEDILLHAQKILEHGWKVVKLYFMIGLPTETDADLEAIVDLCCKVRDVAHKPKLQVTAAISPFVPKPFTPFQWCAQIDLAEITRRINYLRNLCKGKKCITLRWHEPAVSYLEGLLSRGGRNLAPVVEYAYRQGAIFCNWMEHFTLTPWLLGLEKINLAPETLLAQKEKDAYLPWDHLEIGVSKEFLAHEYKKGLEGKTTSDCRYDICHGCGCCDTKTPSSLGLGSIHNILCKKYRDQSANSPHFDESGKLLIKEPSKPTIAHNLTQKVLQYRIWHTKCQGSSLLSQLELQSVLIRALRRAHIPVAFSNGFHPMPLLSFGRALPVGVESLSEWFSLTLSDFVAKDDFQKNLTPFLPEGIQIFGIDTVTNKDRSLLAEKECYSIRDTNGLSLYADAFATFCANKEVFITIQGKKGEKSIDIRPYITHFFVDQNKNALFFECNWEKGYTSPVRILKTILFQKDLPISLRLRKESQILGHVYP